MIGINVPWTPFAAAKGLLNKVDQDLPAYAGEENRDLVYRENAEQLLHSGAGKR